MAEEIEIARWIYGLFLLSCGLAFTQKPLEEGNFSNSLLHSRRRVVKRAEQHSRYDSGTNEKREMSIRISHNQ
ncbi:hypothetical protein PMAYCL1PPCAC_10273, partial [Pristionchus mayeri]